MNAHTYTEHKHNHTHMHTRTLAPTQTHIHTHMNTDTHRNITTTMGLFNTLTSSAFFIRNKLKRYTVFTRCTQAAAALWKYTHTLYVLSQHAYIHTNAYTTHIHVYEFTLHMNISSMHANMQFYWNMHILMNTCVEKGKNSRSLQWPPWPGPMTAVSWGRARGWTGSRKSIYIYIYIYVCMRVSIHNVFMY